MPWIILALIAAGAAWLIAKEGQAIVTHLTGNIPADEDEILVNAALNHGVDVDFLRAIRLTENGPTVISPSGGKTRGMGIVDLVSFPSAKTFVGQVEIASNTLVNTLDKFDRYIGLDAIDSQGHYTKDFIRYFSWGGPGYPGYAPIGASNDPTGMNANHYPNLSSWYARAFGGSPDTILS